MEYCEPIEEEIASVLCAEIKRAQSRLTGGVAAWQDHYEMWVGEPTVIAFSLTRGSGQQQQEAVAEEVGTQPVTVVPIMTARFMWAKLEGRRNQFLIDPAESISRDLRRNPMPTWSWEVTPQVTGERLQLQLTSGYEYRLQNGQVFPVANQETRTATIDVRSRPLSFPAKVLRSWQAFWSYVAEFVGAPIPAVQILGNLLTALAALVGAYFVFRKKIGRWFQRRNQPRPH